MSEETHIPTADTSSGAGIYTSLADRVRAVNHAFNRGDSRKDEAIALGNEVDLAIKLSSDAADAWRKNAVDIQGERDSLKSRLDVAAKALEAVEHSFQLADQPPGDWCADKCSHWSCLVVRALASIRGTP